MDLKFLKGLMSENEMENNGNSNMILLRTNTGELTFTFENDDRLNDAFKEWEQLCLLTPRQHQTILNAMNTCEWDKKVDYIDGNITKVDRYTKEERESILAERNKSEYESFYNSEKAIALRIEEDYRLELEDISDNEMKEVKQYIKAIKPSDIQLIPEITRPEIMNRYN